MTHTVRLATRDGEHLQFDCGPGQTVIEAAEAASITLPSQCRQGSCGACHAHVTAGDFVLGEHSPSALPANGGAHEAILMCRTEARSDLEIALPYDHGRIQFHAIAERNAHIAELETVATNTLRLILKLEPDDEFGSAAEFEPGQFMELGIPGSDVRRAYSLANTPNWDGELEFLIRLQAGGRFSSFLRERAQPEMRLTVRGPLGAFGIDDASLRPRWFVAGGTGLAPILALLRRMAEYQEMHDARLFFGVNHEDELFALDELDRIASTLPQLRVTPCVWKPRAAWSGFTGTPAEALQLALQEADTQPDLYLCGPPPLLDAAEAAARAHGIPAPQIFSERFMPA